MKTISDNDTYQWCGYFFKSDFIETEKKKKAQYFWTQDTREERD